MPECAATFRPVQAMPARAARPRGIAALPTAGHGRRPGPCARPSGAPAAPMPRPAVLGVLISAARLERGFRISPTWCCSILCGPFYGARVKGAADGGWTTGTPPCRSVAPSPKMAEKCIQKKVGQKSGNPTLEETAILPRFCVLRNTKDYLTTLAACGTIRP